ncbi:hypothetical protein KKA15_01515 [Patescibacteria group bacterium]|nr:hypothetical protein [Patescibacteria group bacterium]
MKKVNIIIIILITFGVVLPVIAAIQPSSFSVCERRGHELENEHCIFPDGSKCLEEDFIEWTCGVEYNKCIEEGELVWTGDKCCEGLQRYMNPGVTGHPKCMNVTFIYKMSKQIKYRWWEFNHILFDDLMKDRPIIFWTGVILIIIVIYFIIRFIKKKRNK